MQVDNSSDTQLQTVCEKHIDVITESGFTLPLKSVNMANKNLLMRTIMLHSTLLKNKAVLDQLKSGLSSLGVLNAVMKNPNAFESYFVTGKNSPLTAGTYCVIESFIVKFRDVTI